MKDPAFLFYPGDWLGGTMGMSFEQKGCYIELLMMQFNLGQFTEAHAKHTLNSCFDHAWPMLKHKFETDGTYYWQHRLRYEIEKRVSYTESRRLSGLTPKKSKSHAEHTLKRTENENRNENKDIKLNFEFDLFWNLYDKKVGEKDKIKKKWENLTDDERQLIMDYIPKYKKSQPDKQFRKNPETFFNNKGWNDEIIAKQKETGFTKLSVDDVVWPDMPERKPKSI
jgi:uncharacterized protein YdaU (DUF1376 family)